MKPWIAIAAAAAALAACSSGADSPTGTTSGGLSSYVLTLQQVDGSFDPGLAVKTDTALDLGQAAGSTSLDAADLTPVLSSNGFSGGYERVFVNGDNSLTILVLALQSADSASAVVKHEIDELSTAQNTYVTVHQEIPGSSVFVIGGPNKSDQSQQLQCQGVWFPIGPRAFEVMTCGTTPQWAIEAESVAKTEYDRASQLG